MSKSLLFKIYAVYSAVYDLLTYPPIYKIIYSSTLCLIIALGLLIEV